MAEDLTVEILKEIRDGITSMRTDFNERLDETNERLGQTNERLGQTNERLGRVEQGLLDLGGFMRNIAMDQARHERFHHQHVEVIEKDVEDLKERVQRLEQRDDA